MIKKVRKKVEKVKTVDVPAAVGPVVSSPIVTPAPIIDTSPIVQQIATAPAEVTEIKPDHVKEEVPMETRNLRIYRTGLIVAFLILLFTSVIFWWRVKLPVSVENDIQKDEMVVERPIQNTKEDVVNSSILRFDLTVVVLNGAGVSGLAGKIAEEIKKLGYTKVTTGNSDAVEKTEIKVKAGTRDSDIIKNEMEKILRVEVKIIEEEDLATDIVVVLGNNAITL